MKIIISILLVLLYIGEAFAADPIVYSRCKRTTSTYELSGTVTINGEPTNLTRTMRGLDIYDKSPDVTNFFGDFSAPCDLVYRDAGGVETVIYDCSTTGSTVGGPTCAALDPQVSWDATKIAFSVFRGVAVNHVESQVDSRVLHPGAAVATLGNKTLPNIRISTASGGAELMYHDMVTSTNHTILPYSAGTFDSGPTFIGTNRVAFTSTRDGHTSTMAFRTTSSKKGTRIYSVDLDGKNLRLDSHHSLSQEQHPIMLKNGRIAYSSWQILGGKPFSHSNGSAGSPSTLDNYFRIFLQYPDGSENFALCCMHSGDHRESHYGQSHITAHFLAQTSDERIWWSDYYRLNNNALGSLIGVIEEPMIEGFGRSEVSDRADLFAPRDAINFAVWTTNGDRMSLIVENPQVTHPEYVDQIPFAGRVGYPFALPGNVLGLVWGKGACSVVASGEVFNALGMSVPPVTNGFGSGAAMNVITSLDMDTPGCDMGIYHSTNIPSQHPNDLAMIVDSPDWHEIMARAVVPYSAIFGVSTPTIHPPAHIRSTHPSLLPGEPFGLLGAASITDRETAPYDGITFQSHTNPVQTEHQFNLAGTDTIDYDDEELCGIRLIGLLPNRSTNTYNEILNVMGERTSILGEFHIKHYNELGERIINPHNNKPDTSFLAKLPANVPHLTQAIDCDGRTLNTDMSWQTVKPGEMKTCGGCHVHSRPAELEFSQSYAATQDYTIPVLGQGVVPLLSGKTGNVVNTRTVSGYGYRPTLTQDIKPIFDAHCISCHGGETPAAGLNLSNTTSNLRDGGVNSTWFCLVRDNTQTCVPSGSKISVSGMSGNAFRRPQLTKYMRAFNSRGSLLYWKAANQRLDNRTDGQDAQDINFGADHPTTITAEELGVLSRWIDLGAPSGPSELKDTAKPTLHMAATVVDNEITQLLIGTVDHGEGINTASLNVCLVSGASCGPNLAGSAQLHGITVVNLSTPISNVNQVVRATVSDLASPSNTTQLEHTAGYLMGMAEGVPTPTLSVSVGGNATIHDGSTFSRTISFIDGEDNDSPGRTYSINWCGAEQTGSVSAGNFSFNISRLFSTAGSCLVSVTVTDGIGETDTGSFTITIEEDAPTETVTINVGGPGLVKEGSSLARIVSMSDVSVNWTYSLSVDGSEVDTGSITNGHNSFSVEHIFPDGPAVHNVEVEVSSAVPAVLDTKSFQVTVLNVEPTVTITGNTTVAVNTPYTFSYSVVDPGDDTVIGITVDWGDNNYTNMTTHTYTSAGEYRITVWIEDGDNIWNAGSFKLTVTE